MAKRVSSGSRFWDVILGNHDAVTDSRNLILARRVALWRPRVCGRARVQVDLDALTHRT